MQHNPYCILDTSATGVMLQGGMALDFKNSYLTTTYGLNSLTNPTFSGSAHTPEQREMIRFHMGNDNTTNPY